MEQESVLLINANFFACGEMTTDDEIFLGMSDFRLNWRVVGEIWWCENVTSKLIMAELVETITPCVQLANSILCNCAEYQLIPAIDVEFDIAGSNIPILIAQSCNRCKCQVEFPDGAHCSFALAYTHTRVYTQTSKMRIYAACFCVRTRLNPPCFLLRTMEMSRSSVQLKILRNFQVAQCVKGVAVDR